MTVLTTLCSLSLLAGASQGGRVSDTSAWPRAVEAAVRKQLQRDGGTLWGTRFDTIPLFLAAGKRVFLSADPHSADFTSIGDGWWSGALPSGIVVSNTALVWANRRWAMMRLPLPADTIAAARLVIHERWHVLAPVVLPLPKYNQFDAGAALLDHPDGRIWLRLEWLALAAALDARPKSDAETKAVTAALTFRARRYALATPAEGERERLLDLDEGMPEYSAWRLTNSSSAALAKLLRERAPATPSYGRSFSYFTGPAHGYLLDRRVRGWRGRLHTSLDLQSALATSLKRDAKGVREWLAGAGDQGTLSRRAEAAGARFGLDTIRATETARWDTMQRKLADLRTRFISGPTIRLRPGSVNIGLDPDRSTSLGDDGTVYGDLKWKGANEAELTAPDGGLVNASWSELRIPLDGARLTAGVLTEQTRWSGKGWSLVLPAGWRVELDGASWALLPPTHR